MTKEVTVKMPNIRVEVPNVKFPAGMYDITQSQEYQERLEAFRKTAMKSHQLAVNAKTMIERIITLSEQINKNMPSGTEKLQS